MAMLNSFLAHASDDVAVAVGHDLFDHIAGEHFLAVDDVDISRTSPDCRLSSASSSARSLPPGVAKDGFVDRVGGLGMLLGMEERLIGDS